MLHDSPACHADQASSDFGATSITRIAGRASLRLHTLSLLAFNSYLRIVCLKQRPNYKSAHCRTV